MSDHRPVILLLALGVLAVAGDPAWAQAPPATDPATTAKRTLGDRNDRRLFHRFAEDAAIVSGGWIELQYRYDKFDDGSVHFLGPLVAFKIVNDVEGGVRFGWTDVNPDGGANESGLSDVELYAKYRFPGSGRSRGAVGALVKLPSADESQGLGTGERDFEVFAAWRADMDAISFVANAGYRLNGEPSAPIPPTDDSVFVGGAFILPASPRLTFVLETTWETERFEGDDDDARLILGFQSRMRKGRGGYRAAVALPLGDGAPDYQAIGGLFLTY